MQNCDKNILQPIRARVSILNEALIPRNASWRDVMGVKPKPFGMGLNASYENTNYKKNLRASRQKSGINQGKPKTKALDNQAKQATQR
jgi:hypothetical protein